MGGENDSFHIDELPPGLEEEEKEEKRARSVGLTSIVKNVKARGHRQPFEGCDISIMGCFPNKV